MSDKTKPPDLNDFELALAALAPAGGNFNRDLLMFRAGQRRPARRAWGWQAATFGLAFSTLMLGAVLVLRPAREQPHQVAHPVSDEVSAPRTELARVAPSAGEPETGAPAAALAENLPIDWLRMEAQIIRWGPDALPHSAPAAVAPYQPSSLDDILGGSGVAPLSPLERLGLLSGKGAKS
jgi:hypothetical protein